jgi:hypothetical protein
MHTGMPDIYHWQFRRKSEQKTMRLDHRGMPPGVGICSTTASRNLFRQSYDVLRYVLMPQHYHSHLPTAGLIRAGNSQCSLVYAMK